MADLVWLLDQLTDSKGKILVSDLVEEVCPVTPEEEALYKNIQFDVDEYQKDCGVTSLRFPGNKVEFFILHKYLPNIATHL